MGLVIRCLVLRGLSKPPRTAAPDQSDALYKRYTGSDIVRRMWSTRLHPECEKELLALKEKNNKLLSKVINDVKLLREFGFELLEEERVKKLEKGLFELRTKQGSNINRVLFGVKGDRLFVLATSFVKKSTKTPKGMIETAKKRLKEWKE